MKNAYLIHGTSTRNDDWFPWLEQAAAPEIKLHRLHLPHPFNPQPAEWAAAVNDQVPSENDLIIVAHSLGCITAIRFFEQHQLTGARLLLVGAFDQQLPAYPELNSFMQPAPNYSLIRPQISKATVITAKDDLIAPYQESVKVANALGAKLIVQPKGGHFLSSDGYKTFPLALQELKKLAE